jgi:hypothetical protein
LDHHIEPGVTAITNVRGRRGGPPGDNATDRRHDPDDHGDCERVGSADNPRHGHSMRRPHPDVNLSSASIIILVSYAAAAPLSAYQQGKWSPETGLALR